MDGGTLWERLSGMRVKPDAPPEEDSLMEKLGTALSTELAGKYRTKLEFSEENKDALMFTCELPRDRLIRVHTDTDRGELFAYVDVGHASMLPPLRKEEYLSNFKPQGHIDVNEKRSDEEASLADFTHEAKHMSSAGLHFKMALKDAKSVSGLVKHLKDISSFMSDVAHFNEVDQIKRADVFEDIATELTKTFGGKWDMRIIGYPQKETEPLVCEIGSRRIEFLRVPGSGDPFSVLQVGIYRDDIQASRGDKGDSRVFSRENKGTEAEILQWLASKAPREGFRASLRRASVKPANMAKGQRAPTKLDAIEFAYLTRDGRDVQDVMRIVKVILENISDGLR